MKTPLHSIAALAAMTLALTPAFGADPTDSTDTKPAAPVKLAETDTAKPAATAAATTPAKPTEAAATPAPEKRRAPARIKYVPPAGSLGSATNNSAGGTRGGEKLPTLAVLAPGKLALTTQAHPVLYWYQSAPAKGASFEITLVEPKKPKPLIGRTIPADFSGIVGLPLDKYGVTLEPGIEYQWHVALIPDAHNRSKDAVASGAIKRVAAPAGLEEKIARASTEEQAALFAQNGMWYDALQVISTAITKNPKDSALHKERAELLQQGGLPEVAKAEPH